MAKPEADPRFEALKRQILRLGYVRPGSLVQRFMPCGKPSCHCMARPSYLHGPYSQWSYKIMGKTRTVRLSEGQAKRCRVWIRNHKQLIRLVRRMERLSLRETDEILGAISRP